MMKSVRTAWFLALIAAPALLAQSAVTLTGAGYGAPSIIVAPGQVTTLFVSGSLTLLSAQPPVEVAAQLPLPTSLAGFSATVTQQGGNPMELLPLFSVEQINNCPGGSPTAAACAVTALTVQIPFDLISDYGRLSGFPHTTTISISDTTGSSQSFIVTVLPQNIHLLTTCDASSVNRAGAFFPSGCASVVTHADGTLVSASSPAAVGETVVMYAFGLGVPSTPVTTGAPSPNQLITAPGNYSILFAYRGSGLAAQETPLTQPKPSFVGLTPGQVGLYQVNFTVAAPSGPLAACDTPDSANLLVTLLNDSSPSIDTAALCVANPAPASGPAAQPAFHGNQTRRR